MTDSDDNPPKPKKEPSASFFAMLEETKDTSDRVCAIACCAYIEDRLRAILMASMPGLNSALREKLFDGDGTLGPVMARANVARALGLIAPIELADIKLIASIRNRMAHRIKASFKDEDIKKTVYQLKIRPFQMPIFDEAGFEKVREMFERDTRRVFELTALTLGASFEYVARLHNVSPPHSSKD